MSTVQSAWWTGSLLMLAACVAVHAQDAAAPAPSTRVLPAETEIHLRLLEPVASNTHQHGDRFKLEVAEPIAIDGEVVIPAGAACVGEVVHAGKAGFGGRGGELILVSRFVQVGDREIRLRSFSVGNGEQRVNLAMGLSFVLVGLFVQGKNIVLPAGTDVFAKIASDSELAIVPSVPTREIENNENPQH